MRYFQGQLGIIKEQKNIAHLHVFRTRNNILITKYIGVRTTPLNSNAPSRTTPCVTTLQLSFSIQRSITTILSCKPGKLPRTTNPWLREAQALHKNSAATKKKNLFFIKNIFKFILLLSIPATTHPHQYVQRRSPAIDSRLRRKYFTKPNRRYGQFIILIFR